MRILYVEDNEVNQALVERVVRAKQYKVMFREEGEAALELLSEDKDIELILLDIELAGRMTGLDVVKTLRARNDRRPVIAITAYAMMGDRERILNAGCDGYLPKPLVITDLLTLFEEYEQHGGLKTKPAPVAAPATATAEAAPAASATTEPAKPAAEATPAAPAATEPAKPAAETAPAASATTEPIKPAAEAAPAAPTTTEPAKPAAEATPAASATTEPAKPAAEATPAAVEEQPVAATASATKTEPIEAKAEPNQDAPAKDVPK